MVHVNVGTGNTINNLVNLSRDRVPLILAAGRTPITEKGSFGSRSRQIHWGQEMFDQAGMVRELVKWDYELRTPGQVADVVARAHEVAMSVPRGPVYLVLPREPLSASLDEVPVIAPRPVAAAPYPDPAAIEELAGWIAKAERPLIITAGPGIDTRAVAALGAARGARRHSGRVPQHPRARAALQPPDACRLRLRPAGRRGRPDHRARVRCAVVSGLAAAGAGLPRRAYRRGPGLRALSDALVPERSLDRGAAVARCSARSTRRSTGLDKARRSTARRAKLIERHSARRAKTAEAAQPKANDHRRPFQPRDRRGGRRRRDHLQRISAHPRPLPAREARHVLRRERRPAASAGASAPRSAPSSPRPTS